MLLAVLTEEPASAGSRLHACKCPSRQTGKPAGNVKNITKDPSGDGSADESNGSGRQAGQMPVRLRFESPDDGDAAYEKFAIDDGPERHAHDIESRPAIVKPCLCKGIKSLGRHTQHLCRYDEGRAFLLSFYECFKHVCVTNEYANPTNNPIATCSVRDTRRIRDTTLLALQSWKQPGGVQRICFLNVLCVRQAVIGGEVPSMIKL